jgi:electron transport complex protein RnfC
MDISLFGRGIKVVQPGRVEPPVDAGQPERVTLLLRQCVGRPCTPVVEVGDVVKGGQVVAEGAPGSSAHLHAPFGAEVKGFEEVLLTDGSKVRGIVLEAAPAAGMLQFEARERPLRRSREELIDAIARAGIVHGGGEGKALADVLDETAASRGFIAATGENIVRPIEHLVVRFCDVDPHLATLASATLELGDDTASLNLGIGALIKITGATAVHFVFDGGQRAPAIERLAADADWTVHRVGSSRYPLAADPFVARLVSGREPPVAFRQVHESGTLVLAVTTVLDVARAVAEDRPVTHRLVTVLSPSGRKVVRVPIGIALGELVTAAGAAGGDIGKVVLGGPLDGVAHHTLDRPLTKPMVGLTLMASAGMARFGNEPCIGCGLCAMVCPTRLLPGMLSRYCEFGQWDSAEAAHLFSCVECGCCAYVCPSGRSMVQFMIHGKTEILKARRAN